MQRNKQVAMGRKKFNMDPKKVRALLLEPRAPRWGPSCLPFCRAHITWSVLGPGSSVGRGVGGSPTLFIRSSLCVPSAHPHSPSALPPPF